ncbi:MAG: phage BR0599 family protein [Flavobacteriales bacterium]|nr:phage BR0599 family protein [Flavobacteriales bacterium]
MTFLAAEIAHLGTPIELYQFNYAGVSSYYYTSSDENITVGALEYAAKAIKRAGIEYTADLGKASLEIKAQRDLPVAELFKAGVPSGVVSVTIYRKHRTDNETAVIWKGRVLNVDWSQTEVTLVCEPIRTSLQSFGLRRNFQRQCPHVLYGADCKVSNTTFMASGPVSSFTTNTMTLPAAVHGTDNWFAGGYAQWTNPITNAQERRAILSSVGSTGQLTLLGAQVGLAVGLTVSAFPGCDKSINTCQMKFANSGNYGGFPHTPTKNPFDGTPIY